MYQVRVLSDSEFEALPYPDMDQSLGVADPKTNTAYVRYTGIGEVDKYLINHELDHLIEGAGGEHSDHYENGLYYKKPNQFFETIIPMAASMIPGVGPIAGPASAAVIQSRNAKKAQKGFQGGDSFGGAPDMGGSPMDSFKPQQPNVVTPKGNGFNQGSSMGGNSIGSMQGGGSPIERVRGFFSSRNPQGAF